MGEFDTSLEYDTFDGDTEPLPGGPFWAGQLVNADAKPIAMQQLQQTAENLYVSGTADGISGDVLLHVDGSASHNLNHLQILLKSILSCVLNLAPAHVYIVIPTDLLMCAGAHALKNVQVFPCLRWHRLSMLTSLSLSHPTRTRTYSTVFLVLTMASPAYELYFNQQLVYSYDPVAQGASPLALSPPEDVTVSVSTTVLFTSISGVKHAPTAHTSNVHNTVNTLMVLLFACCHVLPHMV